MEILIEHIRNNVNKGNKLLVLLLLLVFGVSFVFLMQDNNPFRDDNRKYNTENSERSGNGSKSRIKIQEDKKMHQLGKHFNKHGRDMGYSSKAEYNKAAIEFAKNNRVNPTAKIFEGTWNGPGKVTAQTRQIAITYENRTVILDKTTGQVIDFFNGSEFRGLINILKLQ